MEPAARMPLLPALEVVSKQRQDQIVITTMGSAREWPKLSRHALDLHYLPSAMGQAPTLGLGLALSQPRRDVIVFNGDGCMLMNLGCLVTIAASQATNFTLIVLENGIYEVTGGQSTAAAAMPEHARQVDFAGLARTAGVRSVFEFDDLTAWQREAAAVLQSPGPRFVCLHVLPAGADYHLPTMPPLVDRLTAFLSALTS